MAKTLIMTTTNMMATKRRNNGITIEQCIKYYVMKKSRIIESTKLLPTQVLIIDVRRPSGGR